MTMRVQPLFWSVGVDKAVYLFVIEGQERWTIERDGTVVASGPTDDESIRGAIETFCTLPTRLNSFSRTASALMLPAVASAA